MRLWSIHPEYLDEDQKRGYQYNESKICRMNDIQQIAVTTGQLQYEYEHLKRKLEKRSPIQFSKIPDICDIHPNPILKVVTGDIGT